MVIRDVCSRCQSPKFKKNRSHHTEPVPSIGTSLKHRCWNVAPMHMRRRRFATDDLGSRDVNLYHYNRLSAIGGFHDVFPLGILCVGLRFGEEYFVVPTIEVLRNMMSAICTSPWWRLDGQVWESPLLGHNIHNPLCWMRAIKSLLDFSIRDSYTI